MKEREKSKEREINARSDPRMRFNVCLYIRIHICIKPFSDILSSHLTLHFSVLCAFYDEMLGRAHPANSAGFL